jgi:hypothetical protein
MLVNDLTHPPQLTGTTVAALKEWATCEAALAAGQTIMLLRKGGIREPTRSFGLDEREFALFPTFEHQSDNLLKPTARTFFQASCRAMPSPGELRLRLWLRATDLFEVRDPDQLAAIDPYHIWSASYATERLRWRPTQPLLVVLVRAWRLNADQIMPMADDYGGCTSWVRLPAWPLLERRRAVLDDDAYLRLAAPVRSLLSDTPRTAYLEDSVPSPSEP